MKQKQNSNNSAEVSKDNPVFIDWSIIESQIKKDREAVIKHIKEAFSYDMSDFFEDVPIQQR